MLRAIATAPTNGTVIFLVYHDFSGIEVAAWSDYCQQWFSPDGILLDEEVTLREYAKFAGWLECPPELSESFLERMNGWNAQIPSRIPNKG